MYKVSHRKAPLSRKQRVNVMSRIVGGTPLLCVSCEDCRLPCARHAGKSHNRRTMCMFCVANDTFFVFRPCCGLRVLREMSACREQVDIDPPPSKITNRVRRGWKVIKGRAFGQDTGGKPSPPKQAHAKLVLAPAVQSIRTTP